MPKERSGVLFASKFKVLTILRPGSSHANPRQERPATVPRRQWTTAGWGEGSGGEP